ncbi:putative RNA-binding Zn-ribbon protein involved in translation (DUF1610 family) [Sphingobacterium sp. 2149]|nr:putative RNA-binding Zn-ribbon protein involved in translation (DUF1610 family) [Sphingobacterium sp. 2149]
MIKNIAHIIEHCGDPNCSLEYMEYTCPSCGNVGADYSFDFSEVRQGNHTFECEKCNVKLKARFDSGHDLVVETA